MSGVEFAPLHTHSFHRTSLSLSFCDNWPIHPSSANTRGLRLRKDRRNEGNHWQ
jgi:hypothetical protein